jgi:hypothetical protein
MPTPSRTTPPDNSRPAAAETPAGPVPDAAATPDDVVDLVNHGQITRDTADALLNTLAHPRLKPAHPATFSIPVALPVPAGTRPAAAMACLDDTVDKAVVQMLWTTVHDRPDGCVIDPPHPSDPGRSTVRAYLRLTVTVPAYRTYQFLRTARGLLAQDLQQLRHHGLQVGAPRRYHADAEDEDDFAYGDDKDDFDTDRDDTGDGLDPADDRDCPLYGEDELFDVDPFDPFRLDDADALPAGGRRRPF